MGSDGPAFYDDDERFARYVTQRARLDNPNDTLEAPVIDGLVGDPASLRVLDLGCGDGRFGRVLLERGAARYVGVEGSRRMAEAARRMLCGTAGDVVEADLEEWPMPRAAFDLVVSRLVLHYLADLAPVLRRAADALVPGGRCVLSVEHPVITSCARGWPPGQPRRDWIVDDYFEVGARDTEWLGGEVRKYHRTVEDYFTALQRAGFTVEALRESRPERARFVDDDTYARRCRIPLFLFLAGRRD